MAEDHITSNISVAKPPGRHTRKLLHGNFHITNAYYHLLSLNFNSLLATLGAFAAGDEKLLFFSGLCIFVRLVLSKPDKNLVFGITSWQSNLLVDGVS